MLKDLTGQRFGFLDVISQSQSKDGVTYWRCKCDCGKETIVARPSLIQGRTRSCGCYRDRSSGERIGNIRRTHGMSKSRLYSIWICMRDRCSNPNNKRFGCYGGRGIAVCPEWGTFETFRDWALSSGYIDGLSIERKDVNGNYEPQNCSWIPMADQTKNTRSNRWITINGETRILSDWARIAGVCTQTISHRIKMGYPESEWLKPAGGLSNSRLKKMVKTLTEEQK